MMLFTSHDAESMEWYHMTPAPMAMAACDAIADAYADAKGTA